MSFYSHKPQPPKVDDLPLFAKADPDVCANYHGGVDTSVAAHQKTPRAVRALQRATILAAIRARGVLGATSDELEVVFDLTHQACSARFSELKRDGLIVYSGALRKTRSGRNAHVHVVPDVLFIVPLREAGEEG